jgi:Tfp pilus assembly protein PilX
MKKSRSNQRGVVLFVALIALVVMSLAALALVRSVDTNSLIAGNIAFKQSATSSADFAIESVTTFISGKLNANPGYLNTSDPAGSTGYYACIADAITNPNAVTATAGCAANRFFDIKNEASWSNAQSVGTVATPDLVAAGMTVSYVIERMCTNESAPTSTTCMVVYQSGTGGEMSFDTPICNGAACGVSISSLYRVTARVVGPKNTVNYVQAYIN